MKIIKILNADLGREMRPKFACGILDVLGPVGDIVSGTLDSFGLDFLGDAENNYWQAKQMEHQYIYNKNLQTHSAELAQRQWNEQFDKTNQYNLPANQVARLMAAGINPFVDSSTAAPVAGTAQPQGPSSIGVPSVSTPPVPVSGSSAGLRELVEAAKAAKEVPYMEELIQARIKDLLGKVTDAEARAELNKVLADIHNTLGRENKDLENKLLKKQIPYLQSLTDKADMEGLLAWKQGCLADAKAALTSAEYANYEGLINRLFKVYESQARMNNAAAGESVSQTKLNISRTTAQDIENGLNALLFEDKQTKFRAEIDKLTLENGIAAYQLDVAAAKAKEAKVRGDHAEMLFWRDFVLETLEGATDIASNLQKIKSFRSLSESSQKKVEAEVKHMEDDIKLRTAEGNAKYNKTEVTHTQRTPNGTITTKHRQ